MQIDFYIFALSVKLVLQKASLRPVCKKQAAEMTSLDDSFSSRSSVSHGRLDSIGRSLEMQPGPSIDHLVTASADWTAVSDSISDQFLSFRRA